MVLAGASDTAAWLFFFFFFGSLAESSPSAFPARSALSAASAPMPSPVRLRLFFPALSLPLPFLSFLLGDPDAADGVLASAFEDLCDVCTRAFDGMPTREPLIERTSPITSVSMTMKGIVQPASM